MSFESNINFNFVAINGTINDLQVILLKPNLKNRLSTSFSPLNFLEFMFDPYGSFFCLIMLLII